jgi:hypothetical protein
VPRFRHPYTLRTTEMNDFLYVFVARLALVAWGIPTTTSAQPLYCALSINLLRSQYGE